MLKTWLLLVLCVLPLNAAEKQRDWKTGVILESRVEQTTMAWGSILNQKTALVDRRVCAVAAADKNYLVTGCSGTGKQALTVGMSIHFAVEGNTMFVALAGREYRLYVLEVNTAPLGGKLPAEPVVAAPAILSGSNPEATGTEALDNDAVVQMVVGGLKEETVLRVIEARPGKYALGPEALRGLKAAGVTQPIIAAMSAKASTPR